MSGIRISTYLYILCPLIRDVVPRCPNSSLPLTLCFLPSLDDLYGRFLSHVRGIQTRSGPNPLRRSTVRELFLFLNKHEKYPDNIPEKSCYSLSEIIELALPVSIATLPDRSS